MRFGRTLLIAGLIIAIGAIGYAMFVWYPELPPVQADQRTFQPSVVRQGAQLAGIGNCMTCHTRDDGKPYAGGRPVPTPFGTIYATNITPDPDTGIGAWSDEAFLRAMREGVDRRGRHLYPAFPYDHFTKVRPDDLRAIYAFLMTREPVRAEAPANDLVFPLNVRATVAGWKALFLRRGELTPDPDKNADWNRGAYLVEGLAHCGACHTPRNILAAEKRGRNLAGGESDQWHAPALNEASPAPVAWTGQAIANYLRRGRDEMHGAAAGPMAPVVENLARASDDDVRAIATYVASFARAADERRKDDKTKRAQSAPDTVGVTTVGQADPDGRDAVASIYAGACAVCHEAGRGVSLELSTSVNAPDPRNLLHLIMDGVQPLSTTPGVFMPGFADTLTDEQIVALAAYLRGRFSQHPAWPELAATLGKLRRSKGGAG
jgi:mono/diheme cytochrome c family protein